MTQLSRKLEAVLFVASEPVELERLITLTGMEKSSITDALDELRTDLSSRGIRLTEHKGAYRLVTAPEDSQIVRQFMTESAKTDLTRPALETLAIIAYRGPLTKSAIDELRGVSSETMVRSLTQRGLVMEHGRSSEPGRPLLYTVSQAFLQEFGLSKLDELPPLEDAA